MFAFFAGFKRDSLGYLGDPYGCPRHKARGGGGLREGTGRNGRTRHAAAEEVREIDGRTGESQQEKGEKRRHGLFWRAPALAPPPAPAGAPPNAPTPDGFGGGAPKIQLTRAICARQSHKTLASSGSASPFPALPPGGACRSRADMRARPRWVGGRRLRRAGEGGRMLRHQRREVAVSAGESSRKMRLRLHR
jgi:hypothetical protein